MCNPRFKKESYKKRFFRPNNSLIREAKKVIKQICGPDEENQLYGSDEEKLGQLEMVIKTTSFQRKHPGYHARDVETLIEMQFV